MFFSANENLALRQHKRRIIEYVEETMPEAALDAGTNVMVMQVSCRDPGCVPLETAIAIVFPRPTYTKKKSKKKPKALIEGLEESANGGTFKTKILLPMSEVTKDDVLEALPPQFEGGRRTMEKLCLRARDVMLSQITQIMGNEKEDEDGRNLMATYLKECLDDYIARGCVPPPFGEAFPPLAEDKVETTEKEAVKERTGMATTKPATEQAKPKVVPDQNLADIEKTIDDKPNEKTPENESTAAASTAATVSQGMAGTGNFVFRRVLDDEDDDDDKNKDDSKINANVSSSSKSTKKTTTGTTSYTQTSTSAASTTTAMDWRRKQNTENAILSSEKSTIQKLAEREHAPGVRRPGCPCCDIDNPLNVVDEMLML